MYLQTLEGSDGFLCYQETGSQTIENGIEWTVALREGDETLWQREGFSTAHVGWGSLFACQVDGQDYLLSYTPYMGQGWLFFQYQLFSLTEDGEPVMLAEERDVYKRQSHPTAADAPARERTAPFCVWIFWGVSV